METISEGVVLVKPGSGPYQYEDNQNDWLCLHIHPDHFTIDGALLFCRQDCEERKNFRNYRGGPYLKAVFFDGSTMTMKEVATIRIFFPPAQAIPYNYSQTSFEEEFKKFCDGIVEVRRFGREEAHKLPKFQQAP